MQETFNQFKKNTRIDEPEEWLLGIPTDSHQIDEVSEQTRDVSILFGCLGGWSAKPNHFWGKMICNWHISWTDSLVGNSESMGTLGGITNYRVKLGKVSQTNLGRVNGSHGTIHAGWTRSPTWLVWCFCFAFVCLVMFPWSLGHLGGIGFFALFEIEDAQKNQTWIYHICIRMFVRSWPAWWYQFMYTKNGWIYTVHITISLQKPITLWRYLLIVSEIFWDCARRWTRCRCWSWRLIASFDLRSAIRRGKNHLKAVMCVDFVGVYLLYDLYDIRKNLFIFAGDLRFSMEAIYIYVFIHIYCIYAHI